MGGSSIPLVLIHWAVCSNLHPAASNGRGFARRAQHIEQHLHIGMDRNKVLAQAIQAYNEARPHMSCGMKTPKYTHEMYLYRRTNSDVLTSVRT